MPTLDQLDAAVLDPGRLAPVVRQIRGGAVSMTADGLPVRVVGNDAVVYRLATADGTTLALRCPFDDTFAPTHADVYHALAARRAPALSLIADVIPGVLVFRPDGVVVPRKDFRSDAFSAIVMEWIEGTTLLEAVRQACRERDGSRLASLAESWDSASGRIHDAEFVHGDLNARNVMIDAEGRLRFVDLDSCSWPGSPAPPERPGTPGYVHPRATDRTTGASRDAFATLVISVSLHALALEPELIQRVAGSGDGDSGELLFSAADLGNVGASSIFDRLRTAAPPELLSAVEALFEACQAGADEAERWHELSRTPAEQPPRVAEGATANDRARSRDRDVERFKKRWKQGPRRDGDAPPGEEPAETPRHQDAINQLNAAMDAGDDGQVAALWLGLRGDPRLSSRAIAIADLVQRRHGRIVANALREKDDRQLVESVRDAEAAGVAVTASTRAELRRARRRVVLRDRVQAAVAGDDIRFLSELHGVPEVEELSDDEAGADIGGSVRRSAYRNRLERAIERDDDFAIVAAWDPTLPADDAQLDAFARRRVDLAVRRGQWLERTRVALRGRDAGALTRSMADVPEGAVDQLSAVERRRIERTIERAAVRSRLEAALETESREAILEAMNRLIASGATLPESLDWAKLRDVADRESLVRAIRQAWQQVPPDYERLALLLPAARSAAVDSPFLEEDIDVDEIERTVLREDYLRRLRAAMASADERAIAPVAGPDPFGAMESLTPEERAHVDAVLMRRELLPVGDG